MRYAWIILLISALTDFGINAIPVIMAAMMATGSATVPSKAIIILAVLTGSLAGLRTIQQALKATPETAAALKGDVSSVKTTTESKTP